MDRQRTLALTIGACVAALLVPLAWPLVTGRVFAYNDLAWFHLPTRYLYHQALRAGDSLLWTPSIFSGLYLHGEGQLGEFHPLHLLLYGTLPLQAAFNLELIANYPAAFGGMLWLLLRLRFPAPAALFGAMLFGFSGFNLLHHHHVNMVAIVAHLPWLLAATDLLMVDDSPRRRAGAFTGVAAILASELLLGFPQGVLWNGMALAAFAAYRAVEIRQWRPLARCGCALTVGVLIGGIQLVPSADTVLHSLRAGASREFALSYSLHPLNVVQLWSPYALEGGAYGPLDYPWFHEFGIYSGAVLPVAFVWVWARRAALPPPRRRLVIAVTAFAALCLILAFGRHGGLAVLLTYLPVFGSLRASARYIVLVQFSLAILSAITIEDLLAIGDGAPAPSVRSTTLVWIPASLSAATFLLNAGVPFRSELFSVATQAAPGLLLIVVVTALVVAAARRAPWALAALAVVTAADLGWWGIGFVYRERPRTIYSLTQAVALPGPAVEDSYAAAPAEGRFRGDLLVLRGYRLTSGYVALYPVTHHPIDSMVARRLSGTRWNISPDGVRTPFAGGVSRARLLDDQGREASGRVEIAVDRPGYIVVHVDAPDRRVLALTERFNEGWSATASVGPRVTMPIEEDFLGVGVPAGAHRIVFHFMPRSFVWGVRTTAAGCAALVVGVLVLLRGARPGRDESGNL